MSCAAQLTALDLRASFTCDDAFIDLFGSLPRLQQLDISGNRNLTDAGLRSITRLAGSLTQLVLEGGHEVTEDGATALAVLQCLQSLSLAYRCGWRHARTAHVVKRLAAHPST